MTAPVSPARCCGATAGAASTGSGRMAREAGGLRCLCASLAPPAGPPAWSLDPPRGVRILRRFSGSPRSNSLASRSIALASRPPQPCPRTPRRIHVLCTAPATSGARAPSTFTSLRRAGPVQLQRRRAAQGAGRRRRPPEPSHFGSRAEEGQRHGRCHHAQLACMQGCAGRQARGSTHHHAPTLANGVSTQPTRCASKRASRHPPASALWRPLPCQRCVQHAGPNARAG